MKILYKIVALLLITSEITQSKVVGEKQIRLEDIEQDNLRSEREKGVTNVNQYMKVHYAHHQYDVEEPEVQNEPQIIYATKNNYYNPTGHKYVDIKRGKEKVVQPQHNVVYQTEPQQQYITNYAQSNYANVPTQYVYLQQYDPSATNQVNSYTEQQQYYQIPGEEAYQNYAPQVKYITVTSPGDHQPVQPVQNIHPVQAVQNLHPAQSVQNLHPAQSVQNLHPAQPVQNLHQAQPVQNLHQAQPVQTLHPVQPSQAQYLNLHQQKTVPLYYTSPVKQLLSNSLESTAGLDEGIKYDIPKYKAVSRPKQPLVPIRLVPAGHIPQVLPQYAYEVSRPIYSHVSSGKPVKDKSVPQYVKGGVAPNRNVPKQNLDELNYKLNFGEFVHRKPTSLLESYIPSSIQVEYLKRGLSKDALSTYDTIVHTQGFPVKNFESGFLPNQLYTTYGGGLEFGISKRDLKNNPSV